MADVDVVDLLESLEMRNVTVGNREVRFSCPFGDHPHGNRNPAAAMNRETTAWYCHACRRKGNAVTFVALLHGISPMDALKQIQARYGGFREPEGSLVDEINSLMAPPRPATNESIAPLSEELLADMLIDWNKVERAMPNVPAALSYPLERGFTPRILNRYECCWDARVSNRFVLPMRNEDGKLVGFKGRAVYGEKPKYLVLGGPGYSYEPYKITRFIWGLDSAKGEDGVLIEGELNALMARQHGVTGAVGIGGSVLSRKQADLLVSRFSKVTILFDDDKAGRDGTYGWTNDDGDYHQGAIDLLVRRVPTFVCPPHEGDPAEMTKDELQSLIKDAEGALAAQISARMGG